MDDIEFDLYLRKSNKDEHRSVQRQEADLHEGADEQSVRLSERVFIDPDLSASRFKKRDRPDYEALLRHVQSGQCRGIGMVEASRGSRTLTEWSMFLDLCRAGRIKIWVQTHERVYDLSRRQDWRTLADEGVNAADESERLHERVCSGKRKAARAGKPAGPLVYGYLRTYDEKGELATITPHPTRAPIVKELVKRVARNDTLYTIAADLNRRGVPTPRGGRVWSSATVRGLVLSRAYLGQVVHLGAVIGPAIWPALVDEKQHRKAVGLLTRPERRSTTRGTALTHWLSGVALCGACRTDRLRAGSPAKYYCRTCFGVRVGIAPLEAMIETLVLGRLADKEVAALWTPRGNPAALQDAMDDLADLQTTLDTYYTKAARREVTPEGVTKIEAEMLPQIKTAETRVKLLATPSEVAAIGTPEEIIAKWPTLSPADKRIVTRTLVDLTVAPAARRGGRGLDPRRLDPSRWIGDPLTWGEHYHAATAAPQP